MLSKEISNLISTLKSASQNNTSVSTDESTIGINEIVKKAGVFYEKLRYSIDYREEHTIRRSAIERVLNRNLIFNREGKIARILLEELIRGGYIENHKIPEKEIVAIQKIIDKFLFLEESLLQREESNSGTRKRILSFAATEIELFFFNDTADRIVLNTFTEAIRAHVKLPKTHLPPEEEEIQVYLASRRALFKSDEQTLAYDLWLKHFPTWQTLEREADVVGIADEFTNVDMAITRELKEKLGWYLVPKFKNYGIYFAVIKEIVDRYGVESERIFSDQKLLDDEITAILEAHYKKENARTRKSSFRAVIYILLTKIILGIALELPYDLFILHHIESTALALNIIFHPALLFAITAAIKPLGTKNTALAVSGIHSIVYEENAKMIHIKMQKNRSLLGTVFFFIYSVIFLASFSAIIYVLHRFDFNIVSIGLFMFFLTLVSYFGMRIRYNAKRWMVISGEEGTLAFLWNLFTLPIVEVGRWMSIKFSAINIFVFIMDFIVENPFKLILKISDGFVSFVREKREQI